MAGFVANAVDCKAVIENHERRIAHFLRAANVRAGLDAIHSSEVGVVASTHSSEKCHVFENCYILGTVLDGEILIILYQ